MTLADPSNFNERDWEGKIYPLTPLTPLIPLIREPEPHDPETLDPDIGDEPQEGD